MSSIVLHKTLGVNPRMTFCPRCGGDGQELVLLGIANFHGYCQQHGHVYGARGNKCPIERCGNNLRDVKELLDCERVPGYDICDACTKTVEMQKKVISEGGIAFRCKGCGTEGAIPMSEKMAKLIHDVRAKNALGVEVESCFHCAEKEGENEEA